MCLKIPKNQLYLLKKIDIFSQPVQLRLQRSREGGASDTKIGSWFGCILTLGIVGVMVNMMVHKLSALNEYNNISYSSILMKNTFHEDDGDDQVREIVLDDYNFMTSIEIKMIGDEDEIDVIKNEPWTEVLNFDQDDIRHPSLNLDKLSKYLKFYVKFYQAGTEIENKVFRSSMVHCKKEMFKNYEPEEAELVVMEKRLCFDMDDMKDYISVKHPYIDKRDRYSYAIQGVVCEKE